MRRIEFIAPIESMRGDLSGGEKNTYLGGKTAYDAVDAGILHAENYSKRYIGSRKSSNGKKFFSLRTAASVNMTDNRFQMAVFGGTASLASYVKKDLTLMGPLKVIFLATKQPNETYSKWLYNKLYSAIVKKQASVTITGGGTSVTINNPWIEGGTGTDEPVPQNIINKFAGELSAA